MAKGLKLLDAASATGSGVNSQLAGLFCFAVAGTFGGTTVGLDMLGPDDVTWIPVKDASGALAITSADAVLVNLPDGTYRGKITGGSGVSITATLGRAG